MKLKTKLLILAAFFLAIPLVFMGNASALVYTGDGAIHDATTTGWKMPAVDGVTNGCLANSAKTNRSDCEAVRFPTYTTQLACSSVPNFATVAQWASTCSTSAGSGVGLSVKDHDRNALQCDKLGGVWEAACMAKWTAPNALDTRAPGASGGITGNECLRCHSSTIQYNGVAERWKDTYVKTGHKNMLRKVTAGQPWADASAVPYAANAVGSGTTIDWTNATISGTSGGGFTGRQLYYIYGDWMAHAAPSAVYNGKDANTNYAAYSCASCHTTGYVATNSVAGMEPLYTYSSLTSGITGSWDKDGIVCSRCHNASGVVGSDAYRTSLNWGSDTSFNSHNNTVTGALRTSLCLECHNSTQTMADPAGQIKTSAAGNWSGHSAGNQFLNSPHGKFTGTSGQVGTAANYAANFKDGGTCNIVKTAGGVTTTSGTNITDPKNEAECAAAVATYNATSYIWTAGTTQGSCVTCHDVHQSVVPEVAAVEPLKRECATCHVDNGDPKAGDPNAPQVTFGGINHPTGAGTPVGLAGGQNSDACAVCHMATETVLAPTTHLWRINTNPTYSTFPTAAQWSAGTKITFTQADGAYTNAVWVDLDLACGQCHGGSAGVAGVTNGAPYFAKANLAPYAQAMHGGTVTIGGPTSPAAILPSTPGTCDSSIAAASTLTGGSTPCTGFDACGTTSTTLTLADTTTQAHSLFINWGDGSGITSIRLTNTYTHPGHYQVTQTVTNPCGYKSQKVYTVNVTGGTSGKANLVLDATVSTNPVSFQVTDVTIPASPISITNGGLGTSMHPAKTQTVIVDAGKTYTVTMSYTGNITDPVTYNSCTITGADNTNPQKSVTPGITPTAGSITTVAIASCP